MSGDVTDTLPPDGGPSTRDLVLQLLERVDSLAGRLGRVETALGIGEAETQPLSGRVNRLIADLAEFKQETREALAHVDSRLDGMELSLAAIQGDASRRYSRLEERVQRIEHPEEAKP